MKGDGSSGYTFFYATLVFLFRFENRGSGETRSPVLPLIWIIGGSAAALFLSGCSNKNRDSDASKHDVQPEAGAPPDSSNANPPTTITTPVQNGVAAPSASAPSTTTSLQRDCSASIKNLSADRFIRIEKRCFEQLHPSVQAQFPVASLLNNGAAFKTFRSSDSRQMVEVSKISEIPFLNDPKPANGDLYRISLLDCKEGQECRRNEYFARLPANVAWKDFLIADLNQDQQPDLIFTMSDGAAYALAGRVIKMTDF